jgi:hypothetical protein
MRCRRQLQDVNRHGAATAADSGHEHAVSSRIVDADGQVDHRREGRCLDE